MSSKCEKVLSTWKGKLETVLQEPLLYKQGYDVT
jgi:hypothetical protein